MGRIKDHILDEWGLNHASLPRHVGIIMDGNGRYASAKGLPRSMGHRAGVNRLRGIITLCSDMGIEALSLYAFSTENWKRPDEEVSVLCSLLIEYFSKEIDALHKNEVAIRVLGEYNAFPRAVVAAIDAAIEKTKHNEGLKLNIALNYGSRAEVVMAAKSLAVDMKNGVIDDIDENALMDRLFTGGLPELDLIIRTSGEQRLSNFLLLQAAYAEMIFTNDYWPDFSDDKFVECLKSYGSRTRRFGGLV